MEVSPVEQLFAVFDGTAAILQEELQCTYLEALAETGENIFQNTILQEELSEITVKRLEKSYNLVAEKNFLSEEYRKAFQLAILKGMKEHVQPNHQMTPDTVGMLVGYLVNKFVEASSFRLLDPAVGTGNLLTTVINYQDNRQVEAIGIDIDDLLVKLAYVNANLQSHPVQLFNQDSLEPLFVDPVDAVVCDLPVGFYPNDDRAAAFDIRAESGHTYAHHLFIEQSTRYLKPGGYLFLIIPNGLFESEQAANLHAFVKENLNIQSLIQLPFNLVKNEADAKSILILQKKGENINPPKEALLVNLPDLSNGAAVDRILQKINAWFAENK
ncbi:SAM-dependent methyltransferase [Bacillus canaveralius]|uniref:SAM-dependent methyltransferase n=1 Tax=Bacillus canaveralius TaxID=1403243 RepID=A0A2N5GN71_9BACI|nr:MULTISPECIES: class I SAM-dependent methyltransferase [Bacillus]PLR83724.1 SAM-dependent methyltransferase [Bacillus canaveralius]PLR83788.1 SAM-dependent methyltransferase [Bacillus sp. V33-4]PLR95174.1 SAM-dependent methyltransferase [Bacillus canaveralius]RSK53043.1 class I SAM-dependent methyltransferase [Bacillus canaveralius]